MYETYTNKLTNTTYHRCPMQTEKSLPKGKRIMPKTRFTEFSALSVDPRMGISLSASTIDDLLFVLPILKKIVVFHLNISSFCLYFANSSLLLRHKSHVCKQLTSL